MYNQGFINDITIPYFVWMYNCDTYVIRAILYTD